MRETFYIHNGDTVEPHEFTGTYEEALDWVRSLRREGYYNAVIRGASGKLRNRPSSLLVPYRLEGLDWAIPEGENQHLFTDSEEGFRRCQEVCDMWNAPDVEGEWDTWVPARIQVLAEWSERE